MVIKQIVISERPKASPADQTWCILSRVYLPRSPSSTSLSPSLRGKTWSQPTLLLENMIATNSPLGKYDHNQLSFWKEENSIKCLPVQMVEVAERLVHPTFREFLCPLFSFFFANLICLGARHQLLHDWAVCHILWVVVGKVKVFIPLRPTTYICQLQFNPTIIWWSIIWCCQERASGRVRAQICGEVPLHLHHPVRAPCSRGDYDHGHVYTDRELRDITWHELTWM